MKHLFNPLLLFHSTPHSICKILYMFPVTEAYNISIIYSVQYNFLEIPVSYTVNKNHFNFL